MREADQAYAGSGAGATSKHTADHGAPMDGWWRSANWARPKRGDHGTRSTATAQPAHHREHAHSAGSRRRHATAVGAGLRLQSCLRDLQPAVRSAGEHGYVERAEHTDAVRWLRARRRTSVREGSCRWLDSVVFEKWLLLNWRELFSLFCLHELSWNEKVRWIE